MPDFQPYPNESKADFARRMRRQSKGGSMVKAAKRFMLTAEQKKGKKEKREGT